MTDEQIDLDAIEARAKAATPGPWDFEYSDEKVEVNAGSARTRWTESGIGFPARSWMTTDRILEYELDEFEEAEEDVVAADAEFIAHARTDIPALIAEIRRLRQETR